MNISAYNWVLEKSKEALGDKVYYTFETSNYACDLQLSIKLDAVTCPTCFQETVWRSSFDLVDSYRNFDINKFPDEQRIVLLAHWIEKVKIQIAKKKSHDIKMDN